MSSNEMAKETKPVNTVRMVIVISGGILIHLTLGSYYTFGNASPYLMSYLRNRTSEHNLRNEDNLWISNGAAIALPVGVTLGGILDRFLGTRIAVTIGCLIFCTGVVLTYLAIQKSLVAVVFTYGVMTTFGNAIAYGPPVQNVVKWLPSRPTFAVGLIVCGFGGGAVVFNQVITAFVNPNNLSPDLLTADGERYFTDRELLDRVPYLFLLLAGIYAACDIIGIAVIAPPPGDKGNIQDVDGENTKINSSKTSSQSNKSDSSIQHLSNSKTPQCPGIIQVLKNKNAYILWLIVFLIDGGMQFAIGLYKAYGQTFIHDDQFLALVGSISSVFNSVFRPLWGVMMDKYGFQVTMKTLSACFVCLTCTLLFTEKLGKVAYLIWISGLYACFCGIWSVGPSTLGKLFGVSKMAINMGFMFSAVSAATIGGGFIGMDLESVLGWHGLFLLSGGFGALAFFMTFLFNGKDSRGNLF